MDLNGMVESLQRGLTGIPPIAYALMLLAGPTAALIGYRLIVAAHRSTTSTRAEAAAFWVCQSCRSVNELRLSRCYRCAIERDSTDEIEVVVEQPAGRPITAPVPAGSPFAALAATANPHPAQAPGRPVMAVPVLVRDSIAVGPGRSIEVAPAPIEALTLSAASNNAGGDLLPAGGARRRRPARR